MMPLAERFKIQLTGHTCHFLPLAVKTVSLQHECLPLEDLFIQN